MITDLRLATRPRLQLEATGTWQALALGPVQTAAGAGHARRELLGGWLRPARGRWACVRVARSDQGLPIRLVVRGTRGQWPDTLVQLRDDQAWASAWVFIGDHVTGMELDGGLCEVRSLHDPQLRLAEEPAANASLAVEMLTAAALHRMGVRSLREVELTPDPLWPLRAVGKDPQLRFRQIDTCGRVDVHLDLAAEGEVAPPVLYWTDGARGFHPQACRPCVPLADANRDASLAVEARRYVAQLPSLRNGARWRLDPMEAPGRFRVDAVRLLATESEPALLRPLRRCLAWLKALHPIRGVGDLLPAQDLQRLATRECRYLAIGDDPQMRLEAPLAAGWYMLELALDLPGARGRARVYLDDGNGESEEESFSLPLRSGRLAKRLLWIRSRSKLRLDPVASRGEFGLIHFRLQRVAQAFALRRLHRKLATQRALPQHMCESTRIADAGKLPGNEADSPVSQSPAQSTDTLESLWRSYCNLFEPHHEGPVPYEQWIEEVEQPSLLTVAQQAERIAGWSWRPLVSVITPTFNTPLQLLRECVESVLAQTYPYWELCIADDASTQPEVRKVLADYAARDPRIKLLLRERNGHISRASNSAIDVADGQFIALLDHDDVLAPHALFAMVEALQKQPDAHIVYSDEDKLDGDGRRCDAFFKPDWSLDLLRSQNYVSHLGAFRRDLVEAVGRFREGFEGSQDYDLLLRCLAHLRDRAIVLHVPQVLYHWRKTNGSTAAAHEQKPYATEAGRRALQEHADACTPGVRVSVIAPGLYRQRWPIPDPAPLVSLIVPTRDGLHVLANCINSIVQRTTYPQYEILVVDNQSSDPETLAYLEELPVATRGRARVLSYDHRFNYAAINNFAMRHARGSILGLINNDVEVITPDWLTEMTSHASREEVGCVGAKLYYPDDTIQHAGVVLGVGGVAGHSHKYFDRCADGYFSRLRVVHNVSAVTGAVLLVRRAVYEAVGGMDEEHLHVAFNDVDFCLKVRAAGWMHVWTPFAELYHHESKTRGGDTTPEKQARFQRECEVMKARWGDSLARDPFYNPNLTLIREDYSLRTHAHLHSAASMSDALVEEDALQ
jgi:GT2 family glycosyltransferase